MKIGRVAVFVGFMLSAYRGAAAETVTVTDKKGTVVTLRNAMVDYTAYSIIYTTEFVSGIRVYQGSGITTILWSRIDTVTITGQKTDQAPYRWRADIRLLDKTLRPVELVFSSKKGLFGETDLGEFSIALEAIATIEVIRPSQGRALPGTGSGSPEPVLPGVPRAAAPAGILQKSAPGANPVLSLSGTMVDEGGRPVVGASVFVLGHVSRGGSSNVTATLEPVPETKKPNGSSDARITNPCAVTGRDGRFAVAVPWQFFQKNEAVVVGRLTSDLRPDPAQAHVKPDGQPSGLITFVIRFEGPVDFNAGTLVLSRRPVPGSILTYDPADSTYYYSCTASRIEPATVKTKP
jgi:hypothetical protein